MNKALKMLPSFIGLGRHGELWRALLNAGNLIQALAHRPSHVSELVADEFNYIGFCDASAAGTGGVWFSGNKAIQPPVWQVDFPKDITRQVVSDANWDGCLTNLDLEMAGVLLHFLPL
jgi:hypothetical protein